MRIVAARDRSGASAHHPDKYHRERFELFQARALALSNLQETVSVVSLDILAALDSKNLMGEKPSSLLPSVLARISARREKAIRDNRQEKLALSPTFRRDQWNRNEAVAEVCDELLCQLREEFPVNAEEQTGPREESRPVIGAIPVTPGGATLPLSVLSGVSGALSTENLRHHIEECLEALEARGEGDRWTVTETPSTSAA